MGSINYANYHYLPDLHHASRLYGALEHVYIIHAG